MSTDFNPNSSQVLGLEWFPTESGERVLNAATKAAAFSMRSRVSESAIRYAHLAMPKATQFKVNQADWLVEIFEKGDEIPGPVTTVTYRPNGTSKNYDAAWKDASGSSISVGAGTIAAQIGETSLDTSGYAQYTGTYAKKSNWRIEFNTNTGGGAWGPARRVVGGRLVVVADRSEATGRLAFFINDEATENNYAIGEITVDTEIREYVMEWPEINPITKLPWSETEIEDFDEHDPAFSGYTIRIKPIGIGKHKPLRIYQMYLELDYVTENRAAYGYLEFTNDDNWPFAHLFDTSDLTYDWGKQVDTTYTIMCRRIPRWTPVQTSLNMEVTVLEGGSVGWRYLSEVTSTAVALGRDAWLPDEYMASYSPTLNSDGTISELGPRGTRGYGVWLEKSTADGSVDGQPYAALHAEIANDTTMPAQSFITGAGSIDYENLRVLIAVATVDTDELQSYSLATTATSIADLEITVHTDSTGVQVGSTYVLTEDDYLELPIVPASITGDDAIVVSRYRVLEIPLTGVTLSATTKYFVKFSSTQSPVGAAGEPTWTVLYLGSAGPVLVTDGFEAGFGGSTYGFGTAVANVLTEDALADAPMTISTVGSAPSDFAVAIDTQVLITDTQATTPSWLVHNVEFASITWSGTSLGADFLRYEIERSEDEGVTWATIASITDELVEEFRDYEGLRNTECTYRMRVVPTWFIPGAWTDEESVTPVLAECSLLFTSNEDPTLNQGYVDTGGKRTWSFQTADEKEAHVLVGRSYQVVTGPLEYRGDKFDVVLAVWAGSTPENTGRAMFDHIESLNSAATSYVTVLDDNGRRWYADVSVTEGTRTGPEDHAAKAFIIEITDTPSLVNVES